MPRLSALDCEMLIGAAIRDGEVSGVKIGREG